MQATPEQRRCLDLFNQGSLRIEAAAGSGKTTTLRYLMVRGANHGRTLYTSFGRKNIEEARSKFPRTVEVRTNHSLAYRALGASWQKQRRLQGRITALELAQLCGWRDYTFAPAAPVGVGAYAVLTTLQAFCQSADETLSPKHVGAYFTPNHQRDRAFEHRALEWAAETWNRMMRSNDPLPITHDVYLKAWALQHPELGYDTVLLDEAQDTTELMVALLAEQRHTRLVVVGDRYQQIYGWRGAVNAMANFKTAAVGYLTQSFRFGPAIARAANAALATYAEADTRLKGLASITSRVGKVDEPRAVLARTNAGLIEELIKTQLRFPNDRFAVVGGTAELEALVHGAMDLMRGHRTTQRELAEFADWRSARTAAEDPSHAYLRPLVKLVNTYSPDLLLQQLLRAHGNERDETACRRVFSTVHKAKGREFESVALIDDFPERAPETPKQTVDTWHTEEGNLLYVAMTRARRALDVHECPAALDALQRYRRLTSRSAATTSLGARRHHAGRR